MAIEKNIGYIILEGAPEFETKIEIKPKGYGHSHKILAETIFQSAGVRNRNGRFYPDSELDREVVCPRTLELISKKALKSECGHPLSTELSRQSVIWEPNCSCIILSLEKIGSDVKGTFTTTSNGLGKALNEEILDGYVPAFSLRALGNIQQTKNGAEVHNLKMITYDQVIYPSHPNAYMTKLLSENALLTSTNIDDQMMKTTNESMMIPITNEKVIDFIKSSSKHLKFVQECFDFAYDRVEVDKNKANAILTTKAGDIMVVNLENYIHNELINYADEFKDKFIID